MKKFLSVLGSLLFVSGIIIIMYFRFSNPDMTETRLFLTYWYYFLLGAGLSIGGAFIACYNMQ